MVATTDPEPDDWQLVGLAQAGDEPAYAALIERHQGAINGFIFRSVCDIETSCELTQEVFIRAWFALERTRPQARFTTWLFQIAVNLCRDHAKSKNSRQARLTDSVVSIDKHGDEHTRELPSPMATPDRQAQWGETMDVLESEIARLPTNLRETFLLGVIEDHSHKEIAAMLKISAKAVETRIRRARQRLAERLQSLGVEVGQRSSG